ncbi:MAG: FapA family protein [Candidatus Marinimicrobia bacterium]|nr:FapA family protein [Candidatus Neomarinimicrobiota bacterium]
MNIPLAEGQLSLSVLKNGEFILGGITQGSASSAEIYKVLENKGYKHGLLPDNIQKLAQGYQGQLPVATSKIRVELVKYKVDFSSELEVEGVDPYKLLTSLHNQELSGMVMEGDRLLTLTSSSKRIRLRPDGTQDVLSDAGKTEIHHFCGVNVMPNSVGNVITASVDGVAQITTRGKVSVYPFEQYDSIGKLHGNIDSEHALLVHGDISGGANISSPATLIVRGLIRSATIRCGGDLDCQQGLDNLLQGDEGDIKAEQNIHTPIVKNFRVWVGSKLIVSRIIDHANITVMDTLVCPRIADSTIAVGNKLISYNIVRDCVIKFGPDAVEDPFITKFKQTHLSHSRKHHDKHLALESQKAHLEQLRQKSMLILQRLKSEGQSNTMVGNVLKRYITTMQENFGIFKNGYKDLTNIEKTVKQERAELAYNTSLIDSFSEPCLTVVGKLEAGTRLIGPADSRILDRSMSSVTVTLDPETRKLVFNPLKKHGA